MAKGILPNFYPGECKFESGIRRAPSRGFNLTKSQTALALRNALRYIPKDLHEKIAPEFLNELKTRGRVYGYRYRPKEKIFGRPVNEYKGRSLAGRAFQVMI